MATRKTKTTLWISREAKELLDEQRQKDEDYEDVIRRLLSGECHIYVEILSVDGDLPFKHQVIFRLGNFFYHYMNGDFKPLAWQMAAVAKPVEEVYPKSQGPLGDFDEKKPVSH